MPSFWTTRRNSVPVSDYFAATLGSRFERASLLFRYEDWIALEPQQWQPLPGGLHVFTDIEFLPDAAVPRAALLHAFLAGRGRVLNHPLHSLRRLPLHRALHAAGINDFQSYPVDDVEVGRLRFPVFVRRANDHRGSRSELLIAPAQLQRQLAEFRHNGEPMTDWIITEYVETANAQGLRHKYAAFVVGDTIVPRHLFFSARWMIKEADRLSPEMLEQERVYLHGDAHRDQLRTIFRLAGIEYGRIDYSVVGDRLQVWEINTNPQVIRPGHKLGARTAHHRWVEARLTNAWDRLDSLAPVDARWRRRRWVVYAAMGFAIGRDVSKHLLGKRAVRFLAVCRQWLRMS